jgi:hypothetical protein
MLHHSPPRSIVNPMPHQNETVRLTSNNVFQYIGRTVIFHDKYNNQYQKRMRGCSRTGKTIYIEDYEITDNLQIVSRNVQVIM